MPVFGHTIPLKFIKSKAETARYINECMPIRGSLEAPLFEMRRVPLDVNPYEHVHHIWKEA